MPEVVPWRSLPLRRRVVAVAVLVLVALVGVFLIGVGVEERASSRPVAHGVRTQGTVVDVHVLNGRSTTYRADVAFRTDAGRLVVFEGPQVGGKPAFGDQVPVSYAPADPTAAHELRSSGDWVVQLGFGILLVAAALFFATARLRGARRARRRARRATAGA